MSHRNHRNGLCFVIAGSAKLLIKMANRWLPPRRAKQTARQLEAISYDLRTTIMRTKK